MSLPLASCYPKVARKCVPFANAPCGGWQTARCSLPSAAVGEPSDCLCVPFAAVPCGRPNVARRSYASPILGPALLSGSGIGISILPMALS